MFLHGRPSVFFVGKSENSRTNGSENWGAAGGRTGTAGRERSTAMYAPPCRRQKPTVGKSRFFSHAGRGICGCAAIGQKEEFFVKNSRSDPFRRESETKKPRRGQKRSENARPSGSSGGAGKKIPESGKLQGQAVENISVEVFPEEFSAVE